MDYRTGKCSQCGAEYKIPASFAHNVARCKVCKGVVHLGPAQSAGGASAGSAGDAGAPARRAGPRPGAAREQAPHAAGKSPSPAGPRPSRAVPPESGTSASDPSNAPPSERAASPSSEPARSGRRLEPAASASGPRPFPAATRERADKNDAVSRPAERAQKKPPTLAILAGLAVLAVVLVLYLFRGSLFGNGQSTAGAPVAPAEHAAGSAQGDAGANAHAQTPGENSSTREPTAPEPEKPKTVKTPKDPSSIDLAAIPDFQPTSDTTAEEWAQMKEWVAQWMDEDAGAAGNRAKAELAKQKRKAVPAILNFFKKQDFATQAGRDNGDQCQKTLMQICNGTNFDWRYADEAAGRPYAHPEDVYFCKHVVEEWTKAWRPVEQDIEAWIDLAKLEEKDPEEAQRLRAMFGGQGPAEPTDSDGSAGN